MSLLKQHLKGKFQLSITYIPTNYKNIKLLIHKKEKTSKTVSACSRLKPELVLLDEENHKALSACKLHF